MSRQLTTREIQEHLKRSKQFCRAVRKDPELGRQFLIRAGIIEPKLTRDGKVRLVKGLRDE